MRDDRLIFFHWIVRLLLLLYAGFLMLSMVAFTHLSGLDIPVLFEFAVLAPPVTGFLVLLFHRRLIRRYLAIEKPVPARQVTWLRVCTVLHLLIAVYFIYQLIGLLAVNHAAGKEKDNGLDLFLRGLVFCYGVLSAFLLAFQLYIPTVVKTVQPVESAAEETDN